MNILLINHYAGSPEMGMEFRPYYLAREWVKIGYHVRIVAGDYSHLRVKNRKINKDFQKETIDGIDYYWLKTGDYKGNGARRAFTMFRFVGKLWLNAGKIAMEWKPDVVIASSTYPLDTYAAQKIAKKAGAKLIHEVHDMWPATLYEVGGMSRKNPFVVLMQKAEDSAYRYSDKVVSLLPFAKEYMVNHGMRPDKFMYISNGIVEAEWSNAEKLPEKHKNFLAEKRAEGKFIVGYFGGHAISNALDTLLDAAKQIEDSSVVFVLVGNGVEKERLCLRKQEEKIDNLFFLPPVPKKSVPELLKFFDCIYIGAKDSPLYRFGICMNKIFDSMMGEKPIICAITTPESPIEQYKCGIAINSGDERRIAQSVLEIKGMSIEVRNSIGRNGREAALKKFTYKKLAADFAALF
ncbi:glycosyltransferase family 4 protein [[Clostridium] symbiosum]|uniref:glycosyltransferase family 4 protein n=1 Tax=Clostridium symbiosum TaxID=1512 RepID=UPI001D08BDBA|nr:glycosyltransferase family 4 protein [[Clostridium] symbiosum]MCB6607637.1 glycosyltransferase family 4 protein [[Clostridium] symbiosum]MCB6929314.1 glycosyltransferase family 4 protein [[Clostridium] symbiosum]